MALMIDDASKNRFSIQDDKTKSKGGLTIDNEGEIQPGEKHIWKPPGGPTGEVL
jgi:hypothetical protein